MDLNSQTEINDLERRTRRAISPIRPADEGTEAPHKFLFTAREAVGYKELPPPHLIYFLFVELLGFRDLGRFEKLAWSIPIDFEGNAYLIEHRKFGVGVFCGGCKDEQKAAERIAGLIHKGVRCARPFFLRKAQDAVAASTFNVVNNSADLFGRYEYLRALYLEAYNEAERRKDERIVTRLSKNSTSMRFPFYELSRKARWLASAVIDAFFGWTEHAFIHLAILQGRVLSGDDFAAIAGAEWTVKFKKAFDIGNPTIKPFYDDLVVIRRQLRNFMAHGAFGKEGEALHFHSRIGAVPVVLNYGRDQPRSFLPPELGFDDRAAIERIDAFVAVLWTKERAPAKIYIQDSYLDLKMTLARDGTYAKAMASCEAMEELVLHLSARQTDFTNMDW